MPNHVVSKLFKWKQRFFPVIRRQLLKHGSISILQTVETLKARKLVWAESIQFAALGSNPNHSNDKKTYSDRLAIEAYLMSAVENNAKNLFEALEWLI